MRRVTHEQDELGECPTWDSRDGRFRWLDVTRKQVQSCAEDGGNRQVLKVDDYPGSFAMREAGGMLIAFRRRLSLRDVAGAELQGVTPSAVDFDKERFNDGKWDSRGRFWVGSMDRRLKDTVGGLFRVDADLSTHKMAEGYGISNGLAWSADDRLLYHCDSSPARIYVYDFDVERAEVANRRIFADFDAAKGRPDGCAADAEGFLWVAMPGSGRVCRFDPDGKVERSIETPTHYPSSVAFGGVGLKTLYVTSLVPHELPPNDKADPTADGAVFATNVEVAGVPVARFGG